MDQEIFIQIKWIISSINNGYYLPDKMDIIKSGKDRIVIL